MAVCAAFLLALFLPLMAVDSSLDRGIPTCSSYSPTELRITSDGPNGWVLSADGGHKWQLDSEADAKHALRVARSHSTYCQIPSLSSRPIQYWRGAGITSLGAIADEPDCGKYSAQELVSKSNGDRYLLVSGPRLLASVPDAQDASALLAILRQYSYQCFIGRGNKRANRLAYIFEYWR